MRQSKEEVNLKKKAWAKNNRESVKASSAAWYKRNREKVLAKQKAERRAKGIRPKVWRVDITGQRFKRLVAIGFTKVIPSPNGGLGKQYFWKFICDCGTIAEINRNSVTQGKQGTCGNCRDGKVITQEGATRKSIYNSYHIRAERDGRIFNMEEDEFIEMTKMNCSICGVPPSQMFKQSHAKDSTSPVYYCLYTGIDRIDNELGYELGNVRPCCKMCNQAKHAWSEEQFQKWIDRLVKFRNPESLAVGEGKN